MYNTKKYATFFLQPRFLGNMSRKILAYRFFFSKLACGGGSVYQGKKKKKNSAYYLNNVSRPGRILKKYTYATATQLMHELRCIDTCRLSYDKHLSNVEVRAISGNTSVNKNGLSTRTFVCLNHPRSLHAHNVSKSLIDSWRETGQHNFESTFLGQLNPHMACILSFPFPPPNKNKNIQKFMANPVWFKPPQLTNTGGFSLFYCKNTTGNSIFLKLR